MPPALIPRSGPLIHKPPTNILPQMAGTGAQAQKQGCVTVLGKLGQEYASFLSCAPKRLSTPKTIDRSAALGGPDPATRLRR
jgi:hypothetical protein